MPVHGRDCIRASSPDISSVEGRRPRAEARFHRHLTPMKTKQRMSGEFEYAASTWDKPRRVIARLEHGEQGANPR